MGEERTHPDGSAKLARSVLDGDYREARAAALELCELLEGWSFTEIVKTFFEGRLSEVFDVICDAYDAVALTRSVA